jgi:hypothetical protein
MKFFLIFCLSVTWALQPGPFKPSQHATVAELMQRTLIPDTAEVEDQSPSTNPDLTPEIDNVKTNTVVDESILSEIEEALVHERTVSEPEQVELPEPKPTFNNNTTTSLPIPSTTTTINNFTVHPNFFTLPESTNQYFYMNHDFLDYEKYFRQFQKRDGPLSKIRNSDGINTNITSVNSSYALRHIGTLYSSVGYAHVSFIINITELYYAIDGVCQCSRGLKKLERRHTGNQNLQGILAQNRLILEIGCERTKMRIDHVKQTFNVIDIGIPTNMKRHKRQIIMAAAVLAASLTGLFTASTLFKVASDGAKAQENQDFIVEALARNALQVNRTTREIQLTERTLVLLQHHLAARQTLEEVNSVVSMCNNELNSIGDHVDRLTTGLQALLDNRIHSNLVGPDALEDTSNNLRHRLEKIGYAPISGKAADLYQSPASFISANGIIIGFIHLPIHKVELNLDLYGFIDVPILSENHDTHFYLLKPTGKYLAINHEMEVFREFGDVEFQNCKRAESIYYCPLDNILYRYPTTTCLSAIYRKLNLTAHCEIQLLSVRDHLTQTSDVTFRLLQPQTKRIEVTCPPATKKRSLSVQKAGLIDVTVPYGCQAKTDSFIFTPQVTAEASINATHFRALSFEDLLGENTTNELTIIFSTLKANDTDKVTLQEIKAKLLSRAPHPIISHLPYINSSMLLMNIFVTSVVVFIISYLCVKKRTYRGYVPPTGDINIQLTANEAANPTAPTP